MNGFVAQKTEDKQELLKQKLIGIDGKWYDVSNFLNFHPGGPIIKEFIGKDASQVFHAMHEKDVLKYRRPVGQYEMWTKANEPAYEEFRELEKYFRAQGYFNTSYQWYAGKFLFAFTMLACSVVILLISDSWPAIVLSAVFMFLFWQQCGFFVHDFMHTQFSHERNIDRWLGVFFGTVGVGMSAHWWQDEHFFHHALTNTVNLASRFFDPQMLESTWCQNEKIRPFFQTKIQAFFISIQHITFIPFSALFGRLVIIFESFQFEHRWFEWVAAALHWAWMMTFLFQLLSTWEQRVVFYLLVSMMEGILHVQLLISHYCKPWNYQYDIMSKDCWYQIQVESNLNIVNPWWLDWFHGGLNFHIEHHLYPRMPRHNFRKASTHIKKVCQKVGIKYDECCWTDAIVRTLSWLKTQGTHFSLDPR